MQVEVSSSAAAIASDPSTPVERRRTERERKRPKRLQPGASSAFIDFVGLDDNDDDFVENKQDTGGNDSASEWDDAYRSHNRINNSTIQGDDDDDEGFNPFAPKRRQSPAQRLMAAANNNCRLRTLIVLPLSLMEQWRTEFEEFVRPRNSLKILQYHGGFLTARERRRIEKDPEELANYDSKLKW